MTKIIEEEDSLDSTPPRDYLGGQIKSTTGSTGRGWKGTEGSESI